MNTMDSSKKVMLGVIAILILLVIFFAVRNGGGPTGMPPVNLNPTSTPPAASNQTSATGSKPQSSDSSPSQSGVRTISFITPVKSDMWTITQSNVISWVKAAGVSGEIDLLDANKNFVGVVLSQTGPNQTSYAWNTTEYYLGRNSPTQKQMVPGTYIFRLKFDGNNLGASYSFPVTISQ